MELKAGNCRVVAVLVVVDQENALSSSMDGVVEEFAPDGREAWFCS